MGGEKLKHWFGVRFMSIAFTIPITNILETLGDSSFLHLVRGVVARIPIHIMNMTKADGEQIIALFQRIAPEMRSEIFVEPGTTQTRGKRVGEILIDARLETCMATPFSKKFFPEEETLMQRLHENNDCDIQEIQIRNFFSKITIIRELYSQSSTTKRDDPEWFYETVQNNFRKVPVSPEFVQFIVDTR